MDSIKHNNLYVTFGEKGEFALSTEKRNDLNFVYKNLNFDLSAGANGKCGYDFFSLQGVEKRDERNFDTIYKARNGLKVRVCAELVEGLNVLRQKIAVKNESNETIRLSGLYGAIALGIGFFGRQYFDAPNRFFICYNYNSWCAEGQWQRRTPRELGLYPASNHAWESKDFRLSSFGGWDTAVHYPLIIIEDTERNECWFFEREDAESWLMEISAYGGFHSDSLCVTAGGTDEKLGWFYNLKPNESYESGYSFYGVVKGNFEDAINELNAYKRKFQVVNSEIKIVFNDFMNCNWAMPDEKKLISLIDGAAAAGAEVFCIDDGWARIGEWWPLEEVFGKTGFKNMINYIRSKGMIAGLWFEFESAGYNNVINDKTLLRKRNGEIIESGRPKLDMTNPRVVDYLLKKIEYVYSCGVRYIKNDHNNMESVGSNSSKDESCAEGTRKNTLAFYAFIRKIHDLYPDLILENCGAGGGREDFGTNKLFSLQSTSDQEDYRLYPSVLLGQLACLPPEKAGVWAYPYPLLYENKDNYVIPENELESFADGRQTIFNMVSGMAGYMYLSGRIDLVDDLNLKLIKESISVYNGYKDTIIGRKVAFPLQMKNMADKSYNAVGLNGKEDMLLFVWGLEEKRFTLDLYKYGYKTAERIYPVSVDNVNYSYSDGKLSVGFKAKYSAAVFKLK